jgi:virulence factor Mce-like protein
MTRWRSSRGPRRSAPNIGGLMTLGAAMVLVLSAVVWMSFTQRVPFSGESGKLVRVELSAARQITKKTPVRVAGVDVGRVTGVQAKPGGRGAVVELRLDEDVTLREDARATARFRTVLGGNMELTLEPGSPSAPPLGDRVITVEHTRIQTELDDVTTTFRGRTADDQRTVLDEVPKALERSAARDALEALEPGLEPVAPAARALQGERSDDVRSLVRSTARTVAALSADTSALRGLVSGAQSSFRTLSGARRALGDAFVEAPAALAATRRAAEEVDRLRPALDRVVIGLRPSVNRLAPTARDTRSALADAVPTLQAARPLLTALGPAINRLAAAAPSGRRAVAGLRPAVRQVRDDIIPWLEHPQKFSGVPIYQMIGPSLALAGGSASSYDKFGYYINFPSSANTQALQIRPDLKLPLLGRSCASLTPDPESGARKRCSGIQRLFAPWFGAGTR